MDCGFQDMRVSGATRVLMAYLSAIIPMVLFAENLMNAMPCQGEIIWQGVGGVVIVGDWVGEVCRIKGA